MLANKLDIYKGKGNKYVDDNIKEIQELYKNEEYRKESRNQGGIKEDEVILIKPYEVSISLSATITKSSFIDDEVENLIKYMKFVQSSMQTRVFKLLPHYQSLQSREEQDPDFWKEVALTLVDSKHNIEMLRNRYPINMYQGELLYELYFIAINN